MNPHRMDLFGEGDYEDGEIQRLHAGSPLAVALRREPWLNHSLRSRQQWIRLMHNPNVHFVGTILSPTRRQLQLVVILEFEESPDRRWQAETVITLDRMHRFLEQ